MQEMRRHVALFVRLKEFNRKLDHIIFKATFLLLYSTEISIARIITQTWFFFKYDK
jgi:hypothetical protein